MNTSTDLQRRKLLKYTAFGIAGAVTLSRLVASD